jgi:hypothetical protein
MVKIAITKETAAELKALGIDPTENGVDEIGSEATAKDVLVCAHGWELVPPFIDNVRTNCACCNAKIQHRPHAPDCHKVCYRCVVSHNTRKLFQ